MSANNNRRPVDRGEFLAKLRDLGSGSCSIVDVLDFLIERDAILDSDYFPVKTTLAGTRRGLEEQTAKELGRWIRFADSPTSP